MSHPPYDPWDDLPNTTMSAKAALFCIGMVAVALCTVLFAGSSKDLRELAKKEQQQKEAGHGR